MLKHVDQTGHKLCDCGAYHYKHRPGGGCCALNPMGALRLLQREDAPVDDQVECFVELVI